MCDDCAHLVAQVQAMEQELEAMAETLAEIMAFCQSVQTRCDRTIGSGNGGIPRGTWSLLRGRREIATRILDHA